MAGIPIGITSSTTGLSQHKSTIKKKKKHNKIVFLAKYKLNSREFLISKALIDSVINHDEFVLINNVLKKYNKMKEEIKNSNKKKVWNIYKTMLCYSLKYRESVENKNPEVVKT